MARPKKVVDEKQIYQLAAINCSNEEIATIMRVDKRTIERRFAAVIKEGRENGKMSLKRKQFDVAMKGNVSMLIWLGKNMLGQRDTPLDSIEDRPIPAPLYLVKRDQTAG